MPLHYFTITPKVKQLTGSRKKQFRLVTSNTISPVSGWDGGSRECHELVNMLGPVTQELFLGDRFRTPSKEQELMPNHILVTTSVFCGKPGFPQITCREDQVKEVCEWLGVDTPVV